MDFIVHHYYGKQSWRKCMANVMKRDGRVVPFDKNKIKLAILKAFLEVDEEET